MNDLVKFLGLFAVIMSLLTLWKLYRNYLEWRADKKEWEKALEDSTDD